MTKFTIANVDAVNVVLCPSESAAKELAARLDKAVARRRDSDANRDPVRRAIMYIRRMDRADRHRLLLWMYGNSNEGL
jgi:hypothetical protein